MYPNITITKETELEQQEWTFTLFDTDIVLDNYYLRKRQTKRHKFQTEKRYNRLGDRGYGYDRLTSEQVPLTEEMKAEVKQKFMDKIRVCLWEERGK